MEAVVGHACSVFMGRFVTYIGDNGIKVVTRLMGLILGVIGVQMLIDGIGGAVNGFLGARAG